MDDNFYSAISKAQESNEWIQYKNRWYIPALFASGDRLINVNNLSQIFIPTDQEKAEHEWKVGFPAAVQSFFKSHKPCLKASGIQIGGNHYQEFTPQPFEWFLNNQLPFHKADIIKRILRYDKPTGKGVQDLEKIKHEVDLILEFDKSLHREKNV